MKIAVHPSYGTTGFGIGYDEERIFPVTSCCLERVGIEDDTNYFCFGCKRPFKEPKDWKVFNDWLLYIDFYTESWAGRKEIRFEGTELLGWISGWLGIDRDQIVNIELKETS